MSKKYEDSDVVMEEKTITQFPKDSEITHISGLGLVVKMPYNNKTENLKTNIYYILIYIGFAILFFGLTAVIGFHKNEPIITSEKETGYEIDQKQKLAFFESGPPIKMSISKDECDGPRTLETHLLTHECQESCAENIELLAQLIYAEAGNQDLQGMRLVADVVLNRVDSPDWPDTIYDVIYQKNQFSVIANGSFDTLVDSVSDQARVAAFEELHLKRQDYTIYYFNAGDHCINGTDGYKYGDHWFGH